MSIAYFLVPAAKPGEIPASLVRCAKLHPDSENLLMVDATDAETAGHRREFVCVDSGAKVALRAHLRSVYGKILGPDHLQKAFDAFDEGNFSIKRRPDGLSYVDMCARVVDPADVGALIEAMDDEARGSKRDRVLRRVRTLGVAESTIAAFPEEEFMRRALVAAATSGKLNRVPLAADDAHGTVFDGRSCELELRVWAALVTRGLARGPENDAERAMVAAIADHFERETGLAHTDDGRLAILGVTRTYLDDVAALVLLRRIAAGPGSMRDPRVFAALADRVLEWSAFACFVHGFSHSASGAARVPAVWHASALSLGLVPPTTGDPAVDHVAETFFECWSDGMFPDAVNKTHVLRERKAEAAFRALERTGEDVMSDSAVCAITQEPIREEVTLHGIAYERTAILQWISACAQIGRAATNPLTRALITAADVAALSAPVAPRRPAPLVAPSRPATTATATGKLALRVVAGAVDPIAETVLVQARLVVDSDTYEHKPATLVVLVDASESMSWELRRRDSESRVALVRMALVAVAASMRKGDRILVLAHDSVARAVVVDATAGEDCKAFVREVEAAVMGPGLTPGGETTITRGIDMVLQKIREHRTALPVDLFVFTDGESQHDDPEAFVRLAEARRTGKIRSAAVFGVSEGVKLQTVAKIAEAAGGHAARLSSREDLVAACSRAQAARLLAANAKSLEIAARFRGAGTAQPARGFAAAMAMAPISAVAGFLRYAAPAAAAVSGTTAARFEGVLGVGQTRTFVVPVAGDAADGTLVVTVDGEEFAFDVASLPRAAGLAAAWTERQKRERDCVAAVLAGDLRVGVEEMAAAWARLAEIPACDGQWIEFDRVRKTIEGAFRTAAESALAADARDASARRAAEAAAARSHRPSYTLSHSPPTTTRSKGECLSGDTLVVRGNGTAARADQLVPDDLVRCSDIGGGLFVGKLKTVVVSTASAGFVEVAERVRLTPWHPYLSRKTAETDGWKFPAKLESAPQPTGTGEQCFSFVVECADAKGLVVGEHGQTVAAVLGGGVTDACGNKLVEAYAHRFLQDRAAVEEALREKTIDERGRVVVLGTTTEGPDGPVNGFW